MVLVLHGYAAHERSRALVRTVAAVPAADQSAAAAGVRPVDRLHVAQAEPARERIGELELAARYVRATVDHLCQHLDALVGDEDPRAARQCWMRDSLGVGTEKAAGPLDPASATYEPSGCGEVLVVLRVWAVIASAATAASSASAASSNSRTARRGISSAASRSGAAQHVAARLTHERVEVDRQQTVGSRVVAEVEEQELALLVELPAVARGTVELPDVPATRLDGYGLRHG